jgi:hypothetical protein
MRAVLISWLLGLGSAGVCLGVGDAPTHSEAPADVVDAAIERGVDWLLAAQGIDGSWRTYAPHKRPAGVTALGVFTLLKCGLPAEHPAVRKGLAFVFAREPGGTYTASISLMVLAALGPEHPLAERADELRDYLLDNMEHAGWGYPSNSKGEDPAYSDNSNTQYALLALDAAVRLEGKVSQGEWADAGEALLGRQRSDGGWAYQSHRESTAAMTAASVASVQLCLNHILPKGKGKKVHGRLEEARALGLTWLAKHASVGENTMLGKADEDRTKWRLYWLYALERVGSFLDVSKVGGLEWYREGSQALVKEQEESGRWTAGYLAEVNTCFALLFLRQGSRHGATSTPRSRAPRAPGDAPLVVLSGVGHPKRLWVQAASDALAEHLAGDGVVECVEWRINGDAVARVSPEGDVARYPFAHEHSFAVNGTYQVQAVMHLLDTHRRSAGELKSDEIALVVDEVFTDRDEQTLLDLGKSVLPIHDATITTSSTSRWTLPSAVADGLHACQWRAANDDLTPWVRIDFERAVRASSLKLAPAWQVGEPHDFLARPKEVELSLGKGRTVRVTLPDLGRAKHEIPFKKISIKSLEVRVLSTWPGKGSKVVGLAEVELYQ